ncbi:hypothetical protein [Coraliomargarita akajimensis]|uniref:SLA1 homology domain-containing protein n=1 Tax=Coraliomargarita akajimensis (strain DSM 45221 / IAM 15411 / JCM 23193 / KCTC 12865 / 04OKA010-24) TaxID=583355 RepID=D5ENK9_CORAD|nr:hypothetical protein [Coraliomargarita akajimensis]ADE55485.1 hypothetical protein Caka_2469 [Coraliomargarita akajimensis DSM 45221]
MLHHNRMKRLIPIVYIACSILCSGLSASEYRTFTSNDGRTIVAKITAYNPSTGLSIELKNGTQYKNLSLSHFSSADQSYIKEWQQKLIQAKNDAPLQPNSNISITVKRSRDTDLNDKGDPDNLEESLEPGITFHNKDKDLSFQGVEGTLVLIGQSVLNKNEYHILYNESFTVDLPALERVKWKGRPRLNVYDSNPSNGSAFGAKYEGYLLVLSDKHGTVQIVKGSKSRWERVHREIVNASMNDAYSREFDERFAKTTY